MEVKDKDDTLIVRMTKKGKRKNAMDIAARNNTEETIKGKVEEEPVKNRLNKSRTKNKSKSANDDDQLFDREISSDSSDDSIVNLQNVPWKKSDTDKTATANNNSNIAEGTTHKNITLPIEPLETAIPKKKRLLEEEVKDDSDPSETIISKKKQEIEETSMDLTTEPNLIKANESKTNDLISSEKLVSSSSLKPGKSPPPSHVTASESLQIPSAPATSDMSNRHQNHRPEKTSFFRAVRPNPTADTATSKLTPSLISDKTDNLQKDINRLIELVFKDKGRPQTASLETVDMVRFTINFTITFFLKSLN